MIKVYLKATPISQWQYVGIAKDYKSANIIIAEAHAKGYYCKTVIA